MAEYTTLAAVDLGSNSFHCQIARVVGDQVYPLDSLREPVRLGAGLSEDKVIDENSQLRALACLQRFSERLRSFKPNAVRALGTNTLRVAKNAALFLKKAESALGFPIEVIAGREEARLIYLGVAHSLPVSPEKQLVVDIGGGSTEFIIGSGYRPQRLDSLYMGCVSFSRQFFADGKVSRKAMKKAELAARTELQHIVDGFSRRNWDRAIGSSGTARALATLLRESGFTDGDITPDGLERLRALLIRVGDISKIDLPGLRNDRSAVLPGGLAIMSAVLAELDIKSMTIADGAMREGILYDMLGRFQRKDMRDVTVAQFMERYHIDAAQARRVAALAADLHERLANGSSRNGERARYLDWAARLHEIGISVAYGGYHRHSAYIIANAEMPGFSREEQNRIAQLVLAHRRSIKKLLPEVASDIDWSLVLVLRLAVLFCQRRSDVNPKLTLAKAGTDRFKVTLAPEWLAKNPLTAMALREEISAWEKVGVTLLVPGLEALEEDADTELAE